MDAIAVTLASQGRYIGVAPLGTSLTEEQAHQLARSGAQPIVATDADLAGRIAAERDFWMLSCYRLDPSLSTASRRHLTQPTCSPSQAHSAHRRAGSRPTAGRTAHRRAPRQPATR
jgi:hypothetical protein